MTTPPTAPSRRPWLRHLLALVAMALVAVAGLAAAPAGAQEADTGWVRLGHFAAAEQPVDLLIDGQVTAQGIGFRAVSEYQTVAAGTHQFAVVPAGAAPDTPPLLEVRAGVEPGAAVTVAAVASRDGLAGQVYDDELTPPPDGQAVVRFIHASPAVAAVDIGVVDGPTLARDVAYPQASDYQEVPAGTYDVTVTDADDGSEVVRVADWKAAAGSKSTVVVIEGSDGQADVVPVLDAGGTADMPVGGLATGFGGLADAPSSSATPTTGIVVATAWAAAAAGLVLIFLRRSRAPGGARRPAAVLALSGMAGLALAGCGSSRTGTTEAGSTRTTATTTTTERSTPSSSPVTPNQPPAEAPVRSGANVNAAAAVGEPTSVSIPSIGVSSDLVPLGVAADGTAEVPADPQRAGWFTAGPRPGQPGPAVISGHVDTRDGPAVFARLSQLAPGDEVEVASETGTRTFVVDRAQQVAKDAFPTDSVYGPAPGRQLRLITCGGEFDRGTGHYVDNVVVYLHEQTQ